jgi:hypothetical protein
MQTNPNQRKKIQRMHFLALQVHKAKNELLENNNNNNNNNFHFLQV